MSLLLLIIALTAAASLCATDNKHIQAPPTATTLVKPIPKTMPNSSKPSTKAGDAPLATTQCKSVRKPTSVWPTNNLEEPSEEDTAFNHNDHESYDDDDFDDETLAKHNSWETMTPQERTVCNCLENSQQKIAFLKLSAQERTYALQLPVSDGLKYLAMTPQQRDEFKNTKKENMKT